MKSTAKVLFFAAAALWAAAAQALLLTTWKLPSNLEALEAERAASTNEVEVLNVRWADEGNGMTILYRESGGGAVLARSFDEGTVWAKFWLVKSAGKAAGSAGRGVKSSGRVVKSAGSAGNMVLVTAEDDGWDEVYRKAPTWDGLNGGSGFGDWTIYSDTTATHALYWVDGSPAGRMNEGDFTLSAEAGEIAVRRDLATAVTGDGRFSVRVWLGAMQGVFCGFSVYGDNGGELFRWGYGTAETGERGLVYSMDGGNLYELLEEAPPMPTYVDYMLAWERVGDNLLFNLTGESSTGARYDDWFESPVVVENAGAVAGIAVIANSAAVGNPAEITFDRVVVSGYAAVPEPGTLGLLAVGGAMLAARRRRW